MKQCPKCNKRFDDSFGVCLYCRSPLTAASEVYVDLPGQSQPAPKPARFISRRDLVVLILINLFWEEVEFTGIVTPFWITLLPPLNLDGGGDPLSLSFSITRIFVNTAITYLLYRTGRIFNKRFIWAAVFVIWAALLAANIILMDTMYHVSWQRSWEIIHWVENR